VVDPDPAIVTASSGASVPTVDPGLDPGSGTRQEAWAATMPGRPDPHRTGLRLAHRDPAPTVAPGAAAPRAAREEAEDAWLVEGATRALGAGRRARPEEADPERTCFERDRDRILHATAFRRLAGKTQVFVFPHDHQRTRLTHALEVAQVATAVARACRLNQALTEAIALGHDCGHGPGGHASEDALDPLVEGGFDHAPWGADVTLAPLNLCAETLDGIRNHSWSRPAPATPEAAVVSWADRIAYVCHDFEDAASAGIVAATDLPAEVADTVGPRRSDQLGTFVDGLVDTIRTTGVIGLPDHLADALAAFRAFDYERIYLRPASVAQAQAVIRLLRALVAHYADRPAALPLWRGHRDDRLTPRAAQRSPSDTSTTPRGTPPDRSGPAEPPVAGSEEAVRAAVTYVAGMTDRFACRVAVAELGWDRATLPRGVDLGG
jgi:dGTPase